MKIGEKIECHCGAVYEASYEEKRVTEKDDARCKFCRLVICAFPLKFGLRLIKWPETAPAKTDRKHSI